MDQAIGCEGGFSHAGQPEVVWNTCLSYQVCGEVFIKGNANIGSKLGNFLLYRDYASRLNRRSAQIAEPVPSTDQWAWTWVPWSRQEEWRTPSVFFVPNALMYAQRKPSDWDLNRRSNPISGIVMFHNLWVIQKHRNELLLKKNMEQKTSSNAKNDVNSQNPRTNSPNRINNVCQG